VKASKGASKHRGWKDSHTKKKQKQKKRKKAKKKKPRSTNSRREKSITSHFLTHFFFLQQTRTAGKEGGGGVGSGRKRVNNMLYKVNRVAEVHSMVSQRRPFSLSCLLAYWAVLGWMDTRTVDGWMIWITNGLTGYGTFLPDLAWTGRACLVCWPATAEESETLQQK